MAWCERRGHVERCVRQKLLQGNYGNEGSLRYTFAVNHADFQTLATQLSPSLFFARVYTHNTVSMCKIVQSPFRSELFLHIYLVTSSYEYSEQTCIVLLSFSILHNFISLFFCVLTYSRLTYPSLCAFHLAPSPVAYKPSLIILLCRPYFMLQYLLKTYVTSPL